mgnify:CR=1 FL=1
MALDTVPDILDDIREGKMVILMDCLLYTSDAADD